jgi:hypothetical protein
MTTKILTRASEKQAVRGDGIQDALGARLPAHSLASESTARWFINISYASSIELQFPVEVLDRSDDSLTVRFLSTGSVSVFDHKMIRELPFDKAAPRLSAHAAKLFWSKPPQL